MEGLYVIIIKFITELYTVTSQLNKGILKENDIRQIDKFRIYTLPHVTKSSFLYTTLHSPKLDKTFMNQHGHKVASQIVSFAGQKDYAAQSFGPKLNVELVGKAYSNYSCNRITFTQSHPQKFTCTCL